MDPKWKNVYSPTFWTRHACGKGGVREQVSLPKMLS